MITTMTHAAAFVLPATIAAGFAAAFVVSAMRPQPALALVQPSIRRRPVDRSFDVSTKHSADKASGWAVIEAYGTTTGTSFDPQSRGSSG